MTGSNGAAVDDRLARPAAGIGEDAAAVPRRATNRSASSKATTASSSAAAISRFGSPASARSAGASRRCLVSLIDRTAQVETEKSLRAEMLRDSLTGLPNRLAFNERVEAVLEAARASRRAAMPSSSST